jgi:nucleotide-binding universal stress UspA family protein
MIKRILVALSGTPYTPVAVEHALTLARLHDAEVTGVTVTDLRRLANVGPVPVGAGAAAHALAEHRISITEERVEQGISDFQGACESHGITCEVVRETCDPFAELMDLWRFHDLTIIGLRGLFEYGVVHNPDDWVVDIVRRGVRPILAVSREHQAIRRALIAFSGSMESAKAMKRFVQMRPWPDPTVKVVTFNRKSEQGSRLLDGAAVYCRAHGLDAETELMEGNPRDVLLEHAEGWGADLIVMGSSRRGRIFKRVLGDTAIRAIRESNVPLFLTQ